LILNLNNKNLLLIKIAEGRIGNNEASGQAFEPNM